MSSWNAPRLTIAVRGPEVGEARLATRDLIEIAARTEQALKRVAEVLSRRSSGGRGRKPRPIEDQCRLYLVSWKPGSAIAGFELGSIQRPDLHHEVGRRSIDALLEGIEWLSTGHGQVSVPDYLDVGVLEACAALGRTLDHGIDDLAFSTPDRPGCVIYTRRTVDRARTLLASPAATGQTTRTGRLDVLNGHDDLSGRLWEPDGTVWTCRFTDELAELLPDAWRRTVTVVGTVEQAPAPQRQIMVERLLLDAEPAAGAPAEVEPFWEEAELPVLAERQRVGPIARLEDLTAEWTAGALAEDALASVLEDRARRRAAVNSVA